MNKNISVWRGSNTPPTNNHVWIKNDNQIYLHNGDDWENVASKELQWSVLDLPPIGIGDICYKNSNGEMKFIQTSAWENTLGTPYGVVIDKPSKELVTIMLIPIIRDSLAWNDTDESLTGTGMFNSNYLVMKNATIFQGINMKVFYIPNSSEIYTVTRNLEVVNETLDKLNFESMQDCYLESSTKQCYPGNTVMEYGIKIVDGKVNSNYSGNLPNRIVFIGDVPLIQ